MIQFGVIPTKLASLQGADDSQNFFVSTAGAANPKRSPKNRATNASASTPFPFFWGGWLGSGFIAAFMSNCSLSQGMTFQVENEPEGYSLKTKSIRGWFWFLISLSIQLVQGLSTYTKRGALDVSLGTSLLGPTQFAQGQITAGKHNERVFL